MSDFISQYGSTILYTIITAILGYLGITAKSLIEKYLNDKTKREIVRSCVRAVEQLYKDLHGEDKVNKVIEYATEILTSKGIDISSAEIRVLLESFVQEMNNEIVKEPVAIEKKILNE